MKFRVMGIVACFWLVSASPGFSLGAFETYSKAVKFSKAGKDDFAYMHFNDVLRNHPTSRYRERALFAIGEYYFRMPNVKKAKVIFESLVKDYPDSEQKLYVLAYLLGMAQTEEDESTAEELKKQIIDLQQVSLIFREAKEIIYRSPLNQEYKTIISIEKIEFYVEGKLFAKVLY